MNIGDLAPDFELPDQDGVRHRLSDWRGGKVVLYFYPKDLTSGCSRQAAAFAAAQEEFARRGVKIVGVSRDSVASHRKFADKLGLDFTLLADPELTAIQAYGVWQPKKLYGKVSMGVVRTTFLIDESGRISRIMSKVKPDTNAAELLSEL